MTQRSEIFLPLSEFVAATEERNEIPEPGFTRTIRIGPHERLFRVSDELAARSLLDWSDPVQLKLERNEDGSYDLIARLVERREALGA